MKVQRFNPESDFAPMPFEEHICLKALEMKTNNLVWRPQSITPPRPWPGSSSSSPSESESPAPRIANSSVRLRWAEGGVRPFSPLQHQLGLMMRPATRAQKSAPSGVCSFITLSHPGALERKWRGGRNGGGAGRRLHAGELWGIVRYGFFPPKRSYRSPSPILPAMTLQGWCRCSSERVEFRL